MDKNLPKLALVSSAILTAVLAYAAWTGSVPALEWAGIFTVALLGLSCVFLILDGDQILRMDVELGSDIDRQIFWLTILQVVICVYGGFWKIALARLASLMIEEYAVRRAFAAAASDRQAKRR